MKFVLQEPPKWKDRRVEIHMQKRNRDDYMEIFHGDGHEKLGELRIEEDTRNLVFQPDAASKKVVIKNADGSVFSGGQPATPTNPFPLKDQHQERNWEVVDDVFVVTHPKTGKEIKLPVVEAGPETPTESVYEIVGQGEMLFAIAFAIDQGKHSLLTGPTGIGKTTVYRWLAKKLGYNLVVQPIARGTQDRHLLGEYMPAGRGDFPWTDGPTTKAARLSSEHPTILVYDEINRIGNIAEFSRVYSLLDDTRMLELSERRSNEDGSVEQVRAGNLFIGATSNPTDDDGGDYVGVRELDPALASRFAIQPRLDYPDPAVETKALADRVDGLDDVLAGKMVAAAKRIRESEDVRFPISFRELEAWALAEPYFGAAGAAEIAVVSKAAQVYRADIRNLLKLAGLQ